MNKFKQYRIVQWVRSGGKRWVILLAWLAMLFGSQLPALAATNALSGFSSIVPTMSQGSIISTIADGAAIILGIVTAIAVGFGVIMISWGGINLMFGGGTKKQDGTERIRNALGGLIVAVSAGVLTGIAVFIGSVFTSPATATSTASSGVAALAFAVVSSLPHIM